MIPPVSVNGLLRTARQRTSVGHPCQVYRI
jgi:hypothetical protein